MYYYNRHITYKASRCKCIFISIYLIKKKFDERTKHKSLVRKSY